jgi:hypothetical protein
LEQSDHFSATHHHRDGDGDTSDQGQAGDHHSGAPNDLGRNHSPIAPAVDDVVQAIDETTVALAPGVAKGAAQRADQVDDGGKQDGEDRRHLSGRDARGQCHAGRDQREYQ